METFQLHELTCDVLVAGGGPAGVACALAAARQGAKVILCQDRPVLGGNASSEVRMHIVGANSFRPCADLVLEPRETGIVEEIRLENAARNPQRSPSMFDLILYEKCRAEPKLTLLLNTRVTDARTDGKIIREAHAVRPSTEDKFVLRARIFVDCTGDGSLGAAAGVSFMRGREDRAAFGESLALECADEKTLGSTILFMARKHDRPMPFIPPSWSRKFSEEDLVLRRHAEPDVDAGLEYGYWWIEWGGHLDTIKDGEIIRDELLAIVLGIWDHIKNGGDHGAERWALDWFGFVPGKRESRRFIGQYILTEHDVMQSTAFADAIAYGGWPIDLHPPEGIDKRAEPPCAQTPVPLLYDIPLRCCVAREIANLMFAGRNISATHVAFASTRVMATCAVVGEAVGISAAFAIQNGLLPGELADEPATMQAIRQRLLREDLYLIGGTDRGENDSAHAAAITASSEALDGPARNVISGQNRVVLSERGVPLHRTDPGTHRWMSEPAAGFPAWIELRWDNAIFFSTIELVFDTGLHRHLTLTQSDEYCRLMHWGAGQPETVRRYVVELEVNDRWQLLASVRGNWQRRRTHRHTPSASCRALRITVEGAWGIDHARIMQIRVY
ncbi:MAG: FAD-dependent oxidoreductase [Verrucomicrobiota bacterium]|nr:FAD-dependent oxidoreductase [Verrucomicrobiota bacterium]